MLRYTANFATRWVASLAITTVTAVVATACVEPTRQRHGDSDVTTTTAPASAFKKTVVFYSDSIGWEAKEALAARLAEADIGLDYHGYPGMALCDYVNEIPAAARTVGAPLVVVEFSGNIFTPCMQGVPPEEVYKKYRADGEQLLLSLDGEPAILMFASAPIPLDIRRQTAEINNAWNEFATLYPSRVKYVDAAEALHGPDGTPQMFLPCLASETAELGCTDGQIKVRSDDGIHFCPSGSPDPKNWACPAKYASGAVRYAYAIANGIVATLNG
jgi:hypothetical protein